MINEELILDLLDKVDEIIDLINKHQEEILEKVKHCIYDVILDSVKIEDSFDKREPYYELFFKYETSLINRDELINELKLIKTT